LQLKQVRGEVTSASTELAAASSAAPGTSEMGAGSPDEQPSSSLHGVSHDVILVDSEEEQEVKSFIQYCKKKK
jgi:hypothetical protein